MAIRQFMYMPADLEVSAGTEVTWTNEDQILHTVTRGTPEAPMPEVFDGQTDGRDNETGSSFSFEFTEAGSYPYFCTRHPFMQGTITVS